MEGQTDERTDEPVDGYTLLETRKAFFERTDGQQDGQDFVLRCEDYEEGQTARRDKS